ncbi:MAG: hypothetical protein MK132_17730 [Lentisphaerales bacterium]|nr:hypothetical protein [Lentisphaerales bacterium]
MIKRYFLFLGLSMLWFSFTATANNQEVIQGAPNMHLMPLSANGNWNHYNLADQGFEDPILVVGPTYNRENPYTIKIRNLSSEGFEMKIKNFLYQDLDRDYTSVSVLVIERGHYQLDDGKRIIADSTTLVNDTLKRVRFGHTFESKPVVLTSIVSNNGGAPVVTRTRRVRNHDFFVRLREEEAANQRHRPERVDYLVLEEGGTIIDNFDLFTASISQVNHQLTSLEDQALPTLFASMQTERGKDTAWVAKEGNNIYIGEEQSKDNETRHIYEKVGYLSIRENIILEIGDSVFIDPPNNGGGLDSGGGFSIGGGDITLSAGNDIIIFDDNQTIYDGGFTTGSGNYSITISDGSISNIEQNYILESTGGRSVVQLTPDANLLTGNTRLNPGPSILNEYVFSNSSTSYVVEANLSDGNTVYLYIEDLTTSGYEMINAYNFRVKAENAQTGEFIMSLFPLLENLGFDNVESIALTF